MRAHYASLLGLARSEISARLRPNTGRIYGRFASSAGHTLAER